MSNIDDGGFGPQDSPDTLESFTETTSTSWLQRLGNSLFGMLIGFLLLIGSIWGIFWNEGRAVTTARSLTEGRGLVVAIDSAKLDPANEGKLVHLSGEAAATAPLVDPQFQVSAKGLLLSRSAEMYQWREEEKSETRTKLGGGEEKVTTYTYAREWKKEHVDSSRFHSRAGHDNPPLLRGPHEFPAKDAKLGAFALPPAMLELLGEGADYSVTPQNFSAPAGQTPPVKAVGRMVYVGADPARPQVGDLRIAYSLQPNGPVSVIARQTGSTLAPYQTLSGDRLAMMRVGFSTPEEMFNAAEQENRVLTWFLRGFALLVMWIGFSLLMTPLSVLVSVIPFLEDVVSAGTGIVAFLLTLVLGALVIALAWFTVRPLLSVGLIAGGLAIAFGLARIVGRRGAVVGQAAAR